MHLVDKLVLGVGEGAHQITIARSVKKHILVDCNSLRVGLAVSAFGRCPGPGTCPGCEESASALRDLYDIVSLLGVLQ